MVASSLYSVRIRNTLSLTAGEELGVHLGFLGRDFILLREISLSSLLS